MKKHIREAKLTTFDILGACEGRYIVLQRLQRTRDVSSEPSSTSY